MPNNISVVGNEGFADALAMQLGCEFMQMERRIFPDGEVCPRISGSPKGRVILASRMKLPIDPNSYLVELMLASKSLKSSGCDVWIAMPYFIYSRQDKSFRKGEPLSAKSIIELLAMNGASMIFTVSSHADRDKTVLTFSGIPAHNIDGYSLLGERIRQLKLPNPMVIGADMGVDFAARKVSESMGCSSASFSKERDKTDGSIKTSGEINMRGKDVVIVDDIISSGGTMANAARLARESGASSVTITAVHLTKQEAISKLMPLADNFFVTDTIETPLSKVSVVSAMAGKIMSVL